MNDKQKMGTALGAYKCYKSHVDLNAQGLSPLFCGSDTHARKNWGQFRRLAFTARNRACMKSGIHYAPCHYLKLRREQSPFFLNLKHHKTGTIL